MAAANTLQVRRILNQAFAQSGVLRGSTWTDPMQWHDYSTDQRVVTYRASRRTAEIAALATKMLEDAGFDNKVRATWDYVRVTAYLPFTVTTTNGVMHS